MGKSFWVGVIIGAVIVSVLFILYVLFVVKGQSSSQKLNIQSVPGPDKAVVDWYQR